MASDRAYDVVVSGAGPSGSYAAYLCAKRGLETLLLEKERMPRIKCCAGGVLERALRKLAFPVPESLVEKEIHGAAVVYGDSRNEIRSKDRLAITVRRERFDQFLAGKAKEAGAELLEETPLISANERADRVDLVTSQGEVSCRYLVMAEGATSALSRRLFGEPSNKGFAVGMSQYCAFQRDTGDLMEFHFYPGRKDARAFDPPAYGYGWFFPYGGGANIGAGGKGVGKKEILDKMSSIREVAEGRSGPLLEQEPPRAHPLPLAIRPRLHTGRCLAVGDAGGLANPITGEGMSYAFASAEFAARALNDAASTGDAALLARYERWCRDSIVRDIRSAAIIQEVVRGVLGTLSNEMFFANFCSSEPLVEACMGIVRGEMEWPVLLRRVLPRLPRLYFGSAGPR